MTHASRPEPEGHHRSATPHLELKQPPDTEPRDRSVDPEPHAPPVITDWASL